MLRGLLGIGGFLTACHAGPETAAQHDPQAYGYVVLDTTGLSEGIVLGHHAATERRAPDVYVQLRGDPEKLATLRALRWEVLSPSANGRSMFIVGTLLDEVHHTPSDPTRAPSEAYREFVLTDWYLTAPFWAVQLPSGWVPGDDSELTPRLSLALDDFRAFPGKDQFDPAGYVR